MSLLDKLDLLEELCATPAVSGFEEPMIKLVKREMSKYTDDITVDRLGNVIASMKASAENPRTLMVDAHIDEIGFVIRHIRPDGFLRIYRVGYPNKRILPAIPVLIHADDGTAHYGVIGSKSHHYTPDEERDKVVPIEGLFIDAGFSNEKEVLKAGIRVGCSVTYCPNFRVIGDNVMSKTLDNRLLVFAMLSVMEKLAGKELPINVSFVGSVHEEFTSRGATVAASSVRPDMAIILDVTVATDPPDLEGMDLPKAYFGSGVAINTFVYHPNLPLIGTLANPKLYKQLVETATNHKIPHFLSVNSRVLTDASDLQYFGDGVPVIELEIPTRYTHTPIEVATLTDTQALIDLLTKFILEIPGDFDLSRG
jgi:putative aminopeptidase FrvX